MSITSTFNSALSGLTAARRSALVISDNLANALTPDMHAGAPNWRLMAMSLQVFVLRGSSAMPTLPLSPRGAVPRLNTARPIHGRGFTQGCPVLLARRPTPVRSAAA